MKTTLMTIVILFFITPLFSKEVGNKGEHIPFNASFAYPLSMNKSIYDKTEFNLSLFYSHIGKVDGVDLSAMISFVENDMNGVQLSGIFANVGGSFKGVQLGGTALITKGDLKGVQSSSIFGYIGKNGVGVQGNGLASYVNGSFKGVQAAGLTSITMGNMKGLQLSPLVNISGKTMTGAQIAITNVTEKGKGLQFGLVNIAGTFKGVQFGLVNIADKMTGVPFGLVNIAENGFVEPVFYASNLTMATAGIKFTVNNVYSMITLGGGNFNKEIETSISTGLYYGVHLPVSRFYFDLDAGALLIDNHKLFSDKNNKDQIAFQSRAMIGVDLVSWLSFFGGVGVSYLFDNEEIEDGKFKPLFLGGIKI